MISLCMIVKNEVEMLPACLKSVEGIVDEIIIVDTGSTDKTKEIAGEFTNLIYDFEWVDDFSAARNYAFSLATQEYILWLDADDVLLKEDIKKLKTVKENLTKEIDVVSMFYHISFDEYGNPTFKYRRHRLVKREKQFKWHGVVHEYLAVSGNIIHADVAITHRKSERQVKSIEVGRNLTIYKNRLKQGDEFSPRDTFYFANELKDHQAFTEAIVYYEKFLAMNRGWIEDMIQAYINKAACYRAMGDKRAELESLMMSIVHDLPRPEVSCRLGDYYKEKKEYKKAIIWYCLALDVEVDHLLGFQLESYGTWYPHLQLVACYWQIGDKAMSYAHHLMAKDYRPQDPAVLYNEKFFADK